jgi:hypothetical protein
MIQNDPVFEKGNKDEKPVFEKCKGDSETGAREGATLVEVVLRYEVRENGQTFRRTVRIEDLKNCQGVLWTENATKDVTRFRFFSRLSRLCWKPGSPRPPWLRILQSTTPVSATAGADQEGTGAPGQPKMMMMSASVTAESGEVEVKADSGNCYYYKGQIICC